MIPTNPQQFYDLLTKLLQKIGAPSWISITVAWVFILIIALLCAWGILTLANKIIDSTQNLVQRVRNRDPETRRRVSRRQRFAGYIEREMERIGLDEEWRDYKFTELEAEVEAEGRQRAPSVIPFLTRTNSGLRRETSLSKALKSSSEPRILVEGEPGSGKTVALRHVAQAMAAEAKGNQSPQSIIPIYVNLKELERNNGQAIDRDLIDSFVLKSINRVNDRDIEEFLEEEFDLGKREGTWFFLFDSFDELPEVLSSTEADATITSYGKAIYDFLHGLNTCRGVIASRVFRGPAQLGWPRFRITPLSESRQLELIKRVELKPEMESKLIGYLANARPEIRYMAANPLFLSLLCEHMKSGHPFPDNVHDVFKAYVNTRLNRDRDRLELRFGLKVDELESAAENIAFCMALDPKLGLSPTRNNLQTALKRLAIEVDSRFEIFLEALEYIKLARAEVAVDAMRSPTFTFAHRRFQEYFATCIVLREPSRISPALLLTDARWRETAVVLCQTQNIQNLTALLDEMRLSLTRFCCTTPNLIDAPMEYVHETPEYQDASSGRHLARRAFPWPVGSLHVLGIIQDGFGSKLSDLPDDIRMYASQLVLSAMETGRLPDKRWALEVAGIAPGPILVHMLTSAFEGASQWLKEVAYRQAARLDSVPPTIAKGIRIAIVELANHGRLKREQRSTEAHLERLNQSKYFLSIVRLLLRLPSIDMALHILLAIMIIVGLSRMRALSPEDTLFVLITLLLSHLCLRIPFRGFFEWHWAGATVRFICLGILAIGLTANPQLHAMPLAVLYVGLWGYLALAAAYWGYYTGRQWWFLLPVWPFLHLLAHPRSVAALCQRYLFNKIVMGGLVLEAFSLVIMFLVTKLWSGLVTRDFPQLSKVGLFILAVVFTAGLIGISIVWAYRWTYDRWSWHKWLRKQQGYISLHAMCSTASIFYHATYCTRIIRDVRERHKLAPTLETETLLTTIAHALELKQVTRTMQSKQRSQAMLQKPMYVYFLAPIWFWELLKESREISRVDRVEQKTLEATWSKGVQGVDLSSCTKLVFRVESEVLDELYMLLEQIRIARQDESSVAA